MRINELAIDYYDAIEQAIEEDTKLAIDEMTSEFRSWLSSNGYLLEAANDTKQSQEQWKISKTNALKNNIARAIQYATQQSSKDNLFLERNKEIILNVKKYPVKPGNEIKNAPNYMNAIQRLAIPISASIGSINLAKVDPENGPQANGWLKQNLIHGYRGGDFIQYAKAFYYGAEGKRMNLNTNQASSLLQTAFQYCYQYPARMRGAQTDVNGIISYINKDPSTGQVAQTTNSDLAKIAANQAQQAGQNLGRASTNPYANAGMVNADTSFELFMADHFGSDWQSLNEADVTKQQTPTGNTINPMQTNKNQQVESNSKSPNGAPVNNTALAIAKHRAVCDLIEQCFNAKITAMGMVYRDFIFIMRAHIASYKGPAEANRGQMQMSQAQKVNQNQLGNQ